MAHTARVASRVRVPWVYPLALGTAAAILVAWFPLGALIRQQSALSAARTQIALIQAQERNLAAQQSSVSSTQAIIDLARSQYQLVEPGQSLIQVLPGTGSGDVAASTGDPGYAPLVSPSSLTSLGATSGGTAPASSSTGPGFWSRLERTLEFWR